jgi:hypothetical protein
MAIREAAAVRDENQEETEEEREESNEVREAEKEQALVVDAFGGGLDHETVVRFDHMAHVIVSAASKDKLAMAEHRVRSEWDSLQGMYNEQFTALKALESIRAHTIAPMLKHKTEEARHDLEEKAALMMSEGMQSQGKSREALREEFVGHISYEITGAEYHPVALEVFDRLLAPVAKGPEQLQQVEEKQAEKTEEQAEEQAEQQDEKVSA